jgi:hypothetical protein
VTPLSLVYFERNKMRLLMASLLIACMGFSTRGYAQWTDAEGTDLKPPNNRISLQSSRKAIEQIALTCGPLHRSATSFWRRIRKALFF